MPNTIHAQSQRRRLEKKSGISLLRYEKFICILFSVFTAILFFSTFSWASTVQVEIIHSQDKYRAGGTYPIFFHLKISTPWYIHGLKDEGQGLIPTRFSFNAPKDIKVEDIIFPDPERKKFEYTSDALEVYSGEFFVKALLVVDQNTPIREYVVKGDLFYQACSDKVCLPPENVSTSITIQVVSKETSVTALNQDKFISSSTSKDVEIGGFLAGRLGAGFWLTLLAIFLGGLALNLTPCVYPLIPITVSYFGGKSAKIQGSTVLHGIFYLTGLAITYSVLGVSAALSGRMLGSVLQHPVVLIFLAGIMMVLAFSFFGFWEIRIPAYLNKIAAKNFKGYFGTFFMGLTLGILCAPCIGPFILGLLTYVGQQGDPFLGFLYFFILSIGMGLPLCVLAIFSGLLDRLPMSGDWMIWVKKVMGWVLMGMTVYIINPLIPYDGLKTFLYSVVIIAAGIHLGFLDKTGQGFKRFCYAKKALGFILISCSLIYLASSFQKKEGVLWEPYSPEGIVQAVLEDKPVILDFYADWCLPCKELDEKIFHDPKVVQLSKNFMALRLDLTRHHPMQEEIMRQFQVKGVPAVIFLNRNGIEQRALRVEYEVDRVEFLNKMKLLLEKSER